MDDAQSTKWSKRVVPATERTEDREPEDEARVAAREEPRGSVVAGTLRAPWRWEELLVESAVIGHLDRWERRLKGLRSDISAGSTSSRQTNPSRRASARSGATSINSITSARLRCRSCARWPTGRAPARFGASGSPRCRRWRRACCGNPRVSCACCSELGPLADVGPVALREVREVLTPRLLTLTHEPPRRRHGRVFVGTPHAARGRAFRVVFVPGLAERVFPQRLREDPLLLDASAGQLAAPLANQKQRADDERLQLRLAVGAASERVYLSWPRLELQESRPRVPSFYVLDVARAVEGHIPAYAAIRDRAFAAGAATLAWPAPADPTQRDRRVRARPLDVVPVAARAEPPSRRRAARGISTSSARTCSDR